MLCLALGVAHPDYLLDVLSEIQLEGWKQYYISKPFGHWNEAMMLAKLGAMWANESNLENFLPRVEIIKERDEDEIMVTSPGFGGAEDFLRSLHGNR